MIPSTQWDHGGSIAVKTTVVHDPKMSREDPQFKLRMPGHLRDQAEQAAKASGRSLNAEIVTRLEASFLSGNSMNELIPAARAKELALLARNRIPNEVRKRVIEGIARAVTLGQKDTIISLSDLQLDIGISDKDLEELFKDLLAELEKAGYKVKWDDITSMWIEF